MAQLPVARSGNELNRATSYIIGMYPQENLFDRAICPKCNVSWKALEEDLETEPLCSAGLDQALIIINNCGLCQVRFEKYLKEIDALYRARRLAQAGIEYGR